MQTNNKLREALELAKSTFETLIQFQGDEHFVKGWATLGRDAMIAALAEPMKNCEVGTLEEQAERFAEYCDSEVCKRNRCRFNAKALCIERCALAWAQMPYNEGGDK